MIPSKSYTVKDNLMNTMKKIKTPCFNKIAFGGLLILLSPALYGQEVYREFPTACPDNEMNPAPFHDSYGKTGLLFSALQHPKIFY